MDCRCQDVTVEKPGKNICLLRKERNIRVVSESNCIEKKIADSVYQIWRKSGQRNSVPDIVAEFINRGHDFKTSLMAGF